MSIPGAAPSNAASSGAPGRLKEESSAGLGRLVALWYAGLIVAAVLVHCALSNAESTILAAILLAAAVVVPLTLLGYTLRVHGAALNSQILVPAIGPIVIGVLIFEYVEYNKRVDEAYSAQLIAPELVQLSDVKWTAAAAGARSGRLSGEVSNRSPHRLVGINVDLLLYAGNEEIGSTVARTELDVAPGQSQRFESGAVAGLGVAGGTLPCVDERAAAPPRDRGRGDPSRIECVFRLTGTRGEEAFF